MKQLLNELPSLLFAAFAIVWLAWGVWYYNLFLSVPRPLALAVCCLVTLALPPIVGWFHQFRYRLWHYFAWMTLIAAKLAWFSQR